MNGGRLAGGPNGLAISWAVKQKKKDRGWHGGGKEEKAAASQDSCTLLSPSIVRVCGLQAQMQGPIADLLTDLDWAIDSWQGKAAPTIGGWLQPRCGFSSSKDPCLPNEY